MYTNKVAYQADDQDTPQPAPPGTDMPQPIPEAPPPPPPEPQSPTGEQKVLPLPAFIRTAKDAEIEKRYAEEVAATFTRHTAVVDRYCCIGLLEPENSIDEFDLDRVYEAIKALNPNREKDILLIILSRGGSIEPAYQISRLCKASSREKFVVCIPREAKSAATLIALGADEIHMGILGQLGPIDPQLGGLPALGVAQALETIASLSERHPGSADMFARYLSRALTVEQIGYCDRISESAIQYAQRLLSTKKSLSKKVDDIAQELVREYKDHAFVIDLEEARQHLGDDWVMTATPEVALGEELYSLFRMVNLFLSVYKAKKLLVSGRLDTGTLIMPLPEA